MDDEDVRLVPRNGSGTQVARQGFGEQSLERRDSAALAMAERARAEVQARYIVATQRPRDVLEFRVRLLDHCKRLGFAQKARYRKPVGGNTIEGPSIRFVETALAAYGNVLPESSIIFEDETQVVVRVTVTDLEVNLTHAAEAVIPKRVERSRVRSGQRVLGQRVNSKGEPVYLVEATDDDIANAKAARESKLLRNLGLRILPADVVDEAMELCVQTLRRGATADPAAERKRLTDAFHGIGISPVQLASYLGHPLEQIQPQELVELREAYQAIRDGETSWAAIAEAKAPAAQEEPPARGLKAAKEKLGRRKAAPPEDDPVAREVASIHQSLEGVIAHPEWLPGLRSRIGTLPASERMPLARLLADAEAEIEAQRQADDVPDFGEERGES